MGFKIAWVNVLGEREGDLDITSEASQPHLCLCKGDGTTCSGCHLHAIEREDYQE